MKQLWLKARTAWDLGLISLGRYFFYQFGVRTRLNSIQRLTANTPETPFFREPDKLDKNLPASPFWVNTARYFSWFEEPLHGRAPHWHCNPFTDVTLKNPTRPWWQIPDFNPEVGDIKTIWEASRFDWVIAHACQARGGDNTAVARLNDWLGDWLTHNLPYNGPNWKCGQETSIRILHLSLAAILLGQINTPLPSLLALVRLHLQRIAPTIQYALAQNNNHGTSEAAALFIGGAWLSQSTREKQAVKWMKMGRRWLEDRVQKLIASDGSFSQYSINYHRLLLDTLSLVELWCRILNLPAFTPTFYQHAQAATHWLHTFTDTNTGAVPNIGANDGARLLPLGKADYRDYRPTVQLASTLFLGKTAYQSTIANERLNWLELLPPQEQLAPPTSHLFDEGGYAVFIRKNVRLFMRYPRYQFRPSHADALHIDLWLAQENILRDAGSFSYAAQAQWQDYFRSCQSHNTIQFDDRDQMPRLGRFLYGAWLKTTTRNFEIKGKLQTFTAAYQDWWNAKHHRQVQLEDKMLHVTDNVSGFSKKAVLRWRLMPSTWQKLKDGGWQHGRITIQVTANVPIIRQEIVEGWESRYYLQRTPLPVLEVEIAQAGSLHTIIDWSAPV